MTGWVRRVLALWLPWARHPVPDKELRAAQVKAAKTDQRVTEIRSRLMSRSDALRESTREMGRRLSR